MSKEQELASLYNEDLTKVLFRTWIHALRTMPIEQVLADPSLRKPRRNRWRTNETP